MPSEDRKPTILNKIFLTLAFLLSFYWAWVLIQIMFSPYPQIGGAWFIGILLYASLLTLILYIVFNWKMLLGKWYIKISFFLPFIIPFIIPVGWILNYETKEYLKPKVELFLPEGYQGYAMLYFDIDQQNEVGPCQAQKQMNMDRGYIIIKGCNFEEAQNFIVSSNIIYLTQSGQEMYMINALSSNNTFLAGYMIKKEDFQRTLEQGTSFLNRHYFFHDKELFGSFMHELERPEFFQLTFDEVTNNFWKNKLQEDVQ